VAEGTLKGYSEEPNGSGLREKLYFQNLGNREWGYFRKRGSKERKRGEKKKKGGEGGARHLGEDSYPAWSVKWRVNGLPSTRRRESGDEGGKKPKRDVGSEGYAPRHKPYGYVHQERRHLEQ